MTVLEGIQRSTEFLAKKSVESPRLNAELLLAHLLKLPRMKLYLNFERMLTAQEVDSYRDLVCRRSQREPLQHIMGSTSFCGLEILVDRSVLIPRPETEMLAELGWSFLNSLNDGSRNVLEIGTGSGCVAVALARKCPTARIVATDISLEAIVVAKRNAEAHSVSHAIDFLQSDRFAAVSDDTRFDLIISNPPYIPTSSIQTLQPEVREFDPPIALDGGTDGLDFYRDFAANARAFLKPAGKIMLEFGDGQENEIRKIFESQNWIVEEIKQDYTHRPRILVARC